MATAKSLLRNGADFYLKSVWFSFEYPCLLNNFFFFPKERSTIYTIPFNLNPLIKIIPNSRERFYQHFSFMKSSNYFMFWRLLRIWPRRGRKVTLLHCWRNMLTRFCKMYFTHLFSRNAWYSNIFKFTLHISASAPGDQRARDWVDLKWFWLCLLSLINLAKEGSAGYPRFIWEYLSWNFSLDDSNDLIKILSSSWRLLSSLWCLGIGQLKTVSFSLSWERKQQHSDIHGELITQRVKEGRERAPKS